MGPHAETRLCLDACVWIKLLAKEPGHQRLETLFRSWLEAGSVFIEPGLFIFEVHSTLRKKTKRGDVRPSQAEEMGKKLARLPILLYQSEKLFKHTYEWAERLNETVIYDASYLALAAWKGVPYYTADERFYKKAKEHYPNCHLA